MKIPYQLFPCVVVTTEVETNSTAEKWWQKNFYLNLKCEQLLKNCSRVQLYLLDKALFDDYQKFIRVKTKIAEAITSETDLKNAPIFIIVDSHLSTTYKENKGTEFIASELHEIFSDIAPEEVVIPKQDKLYNYFCEFEPDPVFPEHIGEVVFAEPSFLAN